MSRAKFEPAVYGALKASALEMSNREIADLLGVDEASVRRGLAKIEPEERPIRQILAELGDALERAGVR